MIDCSNTQKAIKGELERQEYPEYKTHSPDALLSPAQFVWCLTILSQENKRFFSPTGLLALVGLIIGLYGIFWAQDLLADWWMKHSNKRTLERMEKRNKSDNDT